MRVTRKRTPYGTRARYTHDIPFNPLRIKIKLIQTNTFIVEGGFTKNYKTKLPTSLVVKKVQFINWGLQGKGVLSAVPLRFFLEWSRGTLKDKIMTPSPRSTIWNFSNSSQFNLRDLFGPGYNKDGGVRKRFWSFVPDAVSE